MSQKYRAVEMKMFAVFKERERNTARQKPELKSVGPSKANAEALRDKLVAEDGIARYVEGIDLICKKRI